MIIYRGKGYLGLLIPAVFVVVVNLTVDAVMGDGYYKDHGIIPALTVMLSGVTVWFTGKSLNSAEARELMDMKTREVIVIREVHSMFGIPLNFVGLILVLMGILISF
ncbi:MAG: hypothetical protein AB7E96_11860 [Deferribacterales bacterium]